MRNLIVLMLLVYSASTPALGSRDESALNATVMVRSTCLNFRIKAGGRIMGCLPARRQLQILEYNPGGFSRVSVNGRLGYVHSDYISSPRATGPADAGRVPITGGSGAIPPEIAQERPPAPGITGALNAASARVPWGNSPDKQRWTQAALEAVRANWSKLQNARDIESFCPGYARSSRAEKENCWLAIVGALVRRESNFRPGTVYREGAPLYYNSVGLLQLSHNSRARECIPEGARSESDLKNPELNLRCGIRILARLVGARGQIAGRRGGGAYWSVLRNPGEHRSAKADGIRREASNLFRTQIAGRFPDRALAGVPPEERAAMR